jgi:hypothetical protein
MQSIEHVKHVRAVNENCKMSRFECDMLTDMMKCRKNCQRLEEKDYILRISRYCALKTLTGSR